ncbi:MAG: threonine dehydratase [Candidatus Azotimanducaceae bacterium]|jgi:threonine dehydratase
MNAESTNAPFISEQSIREAYDRIRADIVKTPIIRSETFSEMCGCEVLFKLENLQMTGSFKERGALNKLLSLNAAERKRGVIAASAGNHAQALAYHANRLGISSKIVMPKFSPLVKVRSTEHWGADVILEGETFDDAYRYSQEIVEAENRVYIHPFDDPLVASGQGTLGLEILEDPKAEGIEAILVPVGGGGLISGVATFVKSINPAIKIIGVEEASCTGMASAMAAGKSIQVPAQSIIADGIAVRKVSDNNLCAVLQSVDQMVTVTSDEIANAIMLMLEIEKTVVEGSAAVTIAALLNNKVPELANKRTLSIISGGNIDVNVLAKIINSGLLFDGRIIKFNTIIPDRPGHLEIVLGVFRESGANVLEIAHHRFATEAPVGQIGVSITVETKHKAHILELKSLLTEKGYVIGS